MKCCCPQTWGRVRIYDWVSKLLGEGRAVAPDTISAGMVGRLLRGVTALGGDGKRIVAALGISEPTLRNPLRRLPAEVALRFLSLIEQQFRDPAILLRIGERSEMQNFSDLGYATGLGANLAEVFKANVVIQQLRQNMFATSLDLSAKPPRLIWHCPANDIERYAPFVELSAATYARLAQQTLSEPALLREVEFQHRPRFALEHYEAAFGCPVRFRAPQTRMMIAARQLFRPSPLANPGLLALAHARFRQPADWMAEGKQHLATGYFYLSNALDKSPPTLERMAASFAMSERSLRRKLEEEGLPFRALLDRVRQELCALYHEEGRRSASEIALLLGYSDLSAFSRAHRRWHGVPPTMMSDGSGKWWA
jgi:AraC-like DNA-binding protein